MNEVSIIIKGVRYDAVDIGKYDPTCEECEMPLTICESCHNILDGNQVFKKSDKKVCSMKRKFKNEKPLNEIGKDAEGMAASSRTLTSAIGKLLEGQVNLMIELTKPRLQKKKEVMDFYITKKTQAKWYNRWYYNHKYENSTVDYFITAGELYLLHECKEKLEDGNQN